VLAPKSCPSSAPEIPSAERITVDERVFVIKNDVTVLKKCTPLLEALGIGGEEALSLDFQVADSGISLRNAIALYEFVKKARPRVAVEVGMANGVSAVAILQAMSENGDGRLISIDPFQSTGWKNKGTERIRSCGLTSHRLIEEFDFLALPELLKEKVAVDFAYIDGWHTFDYALLDFWYLDRMLEKGGTVAFNDCGFRAVAKVLKFVRTHRRYDEIEVLPRSYADSSWPKSLLRWLLDFRINDRYFRKRETWEPDWSFFRSF
jgi:predicted O-methyltransferase YrrM